MKEKAERRSDFTTAIRAEFLGSAGLPTGQHPVKRVLQTSAHKLDHARVRGVIKRAFAEFGFIRDENGQDVFFHRSQWKGPEVILDGTPVSFLVKMGQKGLRALAVQIEKSSAAAGTRVGSSKGGIRGRPIYTGYYEVRRRLEINITSGENESRVCAGYAFLSIRNFTQCTSADLSSPLHADRKLF